MVNCKCPDCCHGDFVKAVEDESVWMDVAASSRTCSSDLQSKVLLCDFQNKSVLTIVTAAFMNTNQTSLTLSHRPCWRMK